MAESTPLRAALADRPPRRQAQVLARIGQVLRDALAKRGDDTAEADAAIALTMQWADGGPATGRQFSNRVYDEKERGVLRRLTDAEDGSAGEALWNALTTAILYVAWLAYRETGERMPEDVCEVDETALDLLDEQWRATPTYDLALFAA